MCVILQYMSDHVQCSSVSRQKENMTFGFRRGRVAMFLEEEKLLSVFMTTPYLVNSSRGLRHFIIICDPQILGKGLESADSRLMDP